MLKRSDVVWPFPTVFLSIADEQGVSSAQNLAATNGSGPER